MKEYRIGMSANLCDLLARGYFPKELPPQFTTNKYALRLAGPNAVPTPITDPSRHSLCSDHSVPKGGAIRRNLRLPNPVHFYGLAKHIVDHWEPLKNIFDLSPYSLTKPTLSGDRAFSRASSLRSRVEHRARIRAEGRYLIRADIARFYASIYTHSLPWAVLGKSEAKRQFINKTLSQEWSDKLDKLVRKLNGDQTAGIPVGPDTSLLLAEVLLGRVDAEVERRHPRVQGIRYIDDYEFVTQTRDEAEAVLSTLQSTLRTMELELSATKTSIVELPACLTESWASRLRRYPIDNERPFAQHEDLSGYFDLLFQTMKEFPEEQVLKYAIGRLSRMVIHEDNWTFFEHLLQQCIGVDPSCLPQIGSDVEYYRQCGHPLNEKWRALLNRVVMRQLPIGNAHEAAWAMSLLLQLNLPMAEQAAKNVEGTDDSIVALMGALLANAQLCAWQDIEGLKRFVRPDYLYQPEWLFCYEANVWQWLGGSAASFSDDAWFLQLFNGPSADRITTFLNVEARIAASDKSQDAEDGDDEDGDDLY
jgi:hypothetical protein